MERTCRQCQAPFIFSDAEREFLQRMQFTFWKTKVDLPEPIYCPACRLQGKTCHRNERYLYKAKSSLSGKDMVALYDEGAPWGEAYTVFAQDEWHSDTWDAMSYAKELNLEQSIFQQLTELTKAVPRMGLITVSNENSDFTTGTGYCKNCYLINSSEYCEDCYYGKLVQSSKNCVDCSYTYDSEQCYDVTSIYNCHTCTHLLFSKNCSDCHFSSSLIGCRNCLLFSNLRQKEYCIRNTQVTRAEFEKVVADFKGSHEASEALRAEWREMEKNRIHRASNLVNSEGCTGDYIENSKHCIDCFDLTGSQDCLHSYVGVSIKDVQHCANMYLKVELCLDVLGAIELYHSAYSLFSFYCQDILYCEYCWHCRDCFGCNGLKQKQYCILNKQYTKEEYESLVPQIIEKIKSDGAAMNPNGVSGSWGEFFPRGNAPFGYNESLAQEYFPLSKKDALQQGFLWRDMQDRVQGVKQMLPARMLPDSIQDIPDDVLDWAIQCEKTERPFRIIKQELDFYRSQKLPIPHLHPDIRYDERLAWRNPRKLWARTCAKCGKGIQTTYSPDRPEIVYCEECYLETVY